MCSKRWKQGWDFVTWLAKKKEKEEAAHVRGRNKIEITGCTHVIAFLLVTDRLTLHSFVFFLLLLPASATHVRGFTLKDRRTIGKSPMSSSEDLTTSQLPPDIIFYSFFLFVHVKSLMITLAAHVNDVFTFVTDAFCSRLA
jgi:hypothetical protein